MEPFVTHTGKVIPLRRSNVNTDDIIPARFLKTIKRTGFADALFANWRYLDGRSVPNPEFSLNQPRYAHGSILLSGEDFGCGSSREHAPWALRDFGFRCIIASSFADIFYNNCINNGILPIFLAKDVTEMLLHEVEMHDAYALTIDLSSQSVIMPDQQTIAFTIDAYRKDALLKGLDPVDWILTHSDEIIAYEARHKQKAPWVFMVADQKEAVAR